MDSCPKAYTTTTTTTTATTTTTSTTTTTTATSTTTTTTTTTNIIKGIIKSAGVPSELEIVRILRDDGKRLDGAKLVSWTNGVVYKTLSSTAKRITLAPGEKQKGGSVTEEPKIYVS